MLIFQEQQVANAVAVVMLVWVLTEYALMLIQKKKPQRQDSKNILSMGMQVIAVCIISVIIASQKNIALYLPDWLVGVGCLLILFGVVIRAVVILEMGKEYIPSLETTKEQNLISDGAFNYVRHPAYSAFYISFFGFALTLQNLYLFLFLVLAVLLLLLKQIKIEERNLSVRFGEQWVDYCQKTKYKIIYKIL